MLEDRFDDKLREAARDYNTPPDTPRELMWERIVAARAGEAERAERAGKAEKAEKTEKTEKAGKAGKGKAEGTAAGKAGEELDGILPFRAFRRFRYFRLPIGIAALLAIGIGLGRLTAPRPEPPAPVASVVAPSPRVSEVAYRLATTEHLGQSEAFLTLFRSSVQQPSTQRLASATARQLLATNRLLLDSPAGSDRQTRLLLQDLELVLAQIAQLSARSSSPELDLITEGLEDTGVMSRLRTAVPSGTSATQGVL